jgi:hypothetical protein
MKIREITNSPGYYITEYGEVYNKDNKKLKFFINDTGYKRLRLPSIKHDGRWVNQTVHLIVAAVFLKVGKYYNDTSKVIDHKDTNKLNNHYSNLELVTSKENTNRAHDKGLSSYNLKIILINTLTKEKLFFRSLRELSRYLKCSLNYIRPRILGSNTYPIDGKYIIKTNFKKYLNYISKKPSRFDKPIYVYDHVQNKNLTLTTYTSISILLGIPELHIIRNLTRYNKEFYHGGYTFSFKELLNFTNNVSSKKALKDRNIIWDKLINKCYVCKQRRAQASDVKS